MEHFDEKTMNRLHSQSWSIINRLASGRMTKVQSDFAGPEYLRTTADLLAPLGGFIYCFLRIEREVSWSYCSIQLESPLEPHVEILTQMNLWEVKCRRFSARIPIWKESLVSRCRNQEQEKEVTAIYENLVELNELRNRLAHDPTSSIGFERPMSEQRLPHFSFKKRNNDGSTETWKKSATDLWADCERVTEAKKSIRRLTLQIAEFAPNIKV